MTPKALKQKKQLRLKRKRRIRDKIFGTADKPRVTIFKSNKYIYVQAIDDTQGITLCAFDSRKLNQSVNKDSASKVGQELAQKLQETKVTQVVFDKNGYKYHGVVAVLADTLRENQIQL